MVQYQLPLPTPCCWPPNFGYHGNIIVLSSPFSSTIALKHVFSNHNSFTTIGFTLLHFRHFITSNLGLVYRHPNDLKKSILQKLPYTTGSQFHLATSLGAVGGSREVLQPSECSVERSPCTHPPSLQLLEELNSNRWRVFSSNLMVSTLGFRSCILGGYG